MKTPKRSLLLLMCALLSSSALSTLSASGAPVVISAEENSGQAEEEILLPYQDVSLSFEERAADLVSRMTLEEKQSQLQARTAPVISRLGIRAYDWWSEGLHGVARSGEATVFPTGLGMASTWNPDLVEKLGTVTSDEARAYTNEKGKGLSYWSPTINMARDPRWGRAEETFGEDPYLTGQIGTSYVRGMQGNDERYLKVIATGKHFAANNSEYNRHNGSSDMSDAELRDYYTRAFRTLVEDGNVASIMTSYNRLNGTPMPANRFMIETLLRRTWGFDGYVTSDCGAIRDIYSSHKWVPEGWDHAVSAAEAAGLAIQAGTDLNCGGVYACEAVNAVNEGIISEDGLDIALVRLFTARMRTGEFDPADSVPYSSETYSWNNQICSEEHTALSREASREAVVLLKNEPAATESEKLLPFDQDEVQDVVIVGAQADSIILGDYSGTPRNENKPTPLQSLKNRLGEDHVTWIQTHSDPIVGNYSMNLKTFRFKDTQGNVISTLEPSDGSELHDCRVEGGGNLGYTKPGSYIRFDNIDLDTVASISADCSWPASEGRGGNLEIHAGSADGPILGTIYTSSTGGWQSYQTFEASLSLSEECSGVQNLYFVFRDRNTNVDLTADDQQKIASADAVIAYVGTVESDSAEESDRNSLDLPRSQADLITKLVSMNPRTAVYIQSVSEVNVESFKDSVPALLWCTYNGQAQGEAMADLLFGDANPSGRLPFTWYTSQSDLPDMGDYSLVPNEDSQGRTYQFYTGEVSWPFGHGLSYSSFEYSNLTLDKTTVTPDDHIQVSVDVTNTSDVDGQEVVQLYVVSPQAAEISRADRQLKGFEKVSLKAHETRTVVLDLDVSDLWFWDEEKNAQSFDQGEMMLEIGRSAADIRQSAPVILNGEAKKVLTTVRAIPDKVCLDGNDENEKAKTVLSAALNDETFINLEEATVLWTSSRPEVASVDEKGTVTSKKAGTALITATVTWNGQSISDSYPISVTKEEDEKFHQFADTHFDAMSSADELVRAGWNIIRPDSSSPVRIEPGEGLQISSGRGDLYQTSNTARNLVSMDLEGNWAVTVKMNTDFVPNAIYQQAGLLIYDDDDNYMKLCSIENGQGSEMQLGIETGGSWSDVKRTALAAENLRLRVEKQNKSYTFTYTAENGEPVQAGTITAAFKHPKLVLFAFNGEQNKAAMTATFKEVLFDRAKEEEKADKTMLQQAVDEAIRLKENNALEGVNPLVARNFNTALENAQAVLASDSAAQEEVNEAWMNLSRAIQMLSFTTDKTELQALIEKAQAVNLDLYEPGETVDEFSAALNYAIEVNSREDVLTEGSIAKAIERLTKAMEALESVRKPEVQIDSDLLQLLVDSVKEADLEKYVLSGQEEFKAALSQAEEVLADPESQGAVDDAARALHHAWLNLRLKADESLLALIQQTLVQAEAVSLSLCSLEDQNFVSTWCGSARALITTEEPDAQETRKLAEEALKVRKILDGATEQKPENPADEKTALEKPESSTIPASSTEKQEPESSRKQQPSVNRSVKTASGFLMETIGGLAAAAASLGVLIRVRKRDNR